MSVASEE